MRIKFNAKNSIQIANRQCNELSPWSTSNVLSIQQHALHQIRTFVFHHQSIINTTSFIHWFHFIPFHHHSSVHHQSIPSSIHSIIIYYVLWILLCSLHASLILGKLILNESIGVISGKCLDPLGVVGSNVELFGLNTGVTVCVIVALFPLAVPVAFWVSLSVHAVSLLSGVNGCGVYQW